MTKQTIFGIDGSVLHTGEAPTKREFVQSLAQAGCRLAGARLRGADLSYLDLTRVNLTGADLSDAVLRGTIADDACFEGACLDGARMDGMRARRANFVHVRIAPSTKGEPSLAGAVLTYSKFSYASLDRANFDGAGLSGTSFKGARIENCFFRKAWLGNADFQDCDTERNDFSGASFRSEATMRRLPEAASPELTTGASAVGNIYAGASLPPTLTAFRRDKVAGYIERLTGVVASAGALLAAGGLIEGFGDQASLEGAFQGAVGTGVAFFLASTAVGLLSDKVTDYLKDAITGATTKAQRFIRQCASEIARRADRLSDYVFAVAKGPSRKILRQVMTLGGDGRELDVGSATFMLVSKRNAAECLARLSRAYIAPESTGDMLVVATESPDDAPSALRFSKSGGCTAFWVTGGEVVGWRTFTKWGDELVSWGQVGQGDALQVRADFERNILTMFGAPIDFRYDPDTHAIREGRDGSIVVVHRSTSLPSNCDSGYVLVRPTGEAYGADAAKAIAQGAVPGMNP